MRSKKLMPLLGLLLAGCSPYPEAPAVPLDPTTIARTGHSNDHLVCPPHVCAATADAEAPVLAMTPAALHARWLEVIEAAPRTRIVDSRADLGLIHAEQRSRIFRFVDTILIKVIADGEGASYAVYSRSELGLNDVGVNKARVEVWTAAIGDD